MGVADRCRECKQRENAGEDLEAGGERGRCGRSYVSHGFLLYGVSPCARPAGRRPSRPILHVQWTPMTERYTNHPFFRLAAGMRHAGKVPTPITGRRDAARPHGLRGMYGPGIILERVPPFGQGPQTCGLIEADDVASHCPGSRSRLHRWPPIALACLATTAALRRSPACTAQAVRRASTASRPRASRPRHRARARRPPAA